MPSTPIEPDHPSIKELIEALEAPGLLLDQPAVQFLLEERRLKLEALESRPKLTLIRGGRED